MKKLITAAALGLALVAGSASADKLVLMDEQLDNVNAGSAWSDAWAGAYAFGSHNAGSYADTYTVAVSTYYFNLAEAGSYSSSYAD